MLRWFIFVIIVFSPRGPEAIPVLCDGDDDALPGAGRDAQLLELRLLHPQVHLAYLLATEMRAPKHNWWKDFSFSA